MSLAGNDLADPLHIQRLEKSLRLEPFLSHVESVLNNESSELDESENELGPSTASCVNGNGAIAENRLATNGLTSFDIESERKKNKEHFFNFSQMDGNREWLKDVLLQDSSEEEDVEMTNEKYKEMLKFHKMKRKYQEKYYSDPLNRQYMYYSAGLLSKHDPFLEHQKAVLGPKKIVKDFRPLPFTLLDKTDRVVRKKKSKSKDQAGSVPPVSATPTPPIPSELKETLTPETLGMSGFPSNIKVKSEVVSLPGSPAHSMVKIEPEDYDDPELDLDGWDEPSPAPSPRPTVKGRRIKKEPEGRKKKEKAPTFEQLNKKRRKLWTLVAKKEIGKASKSRNNNVKEKLLSCKRTATACMRISRQKAMQSQRVMKETVWRLKRMTREMQSYWKRYDRVERTQRRIAEKEAEEQRKIDFEIMEARRQQRKLNFLITQTELYAHFMSKKLGGAAAVEQSKILSQLEEEKNPRLAYLDDYDSGSVKERALRNVNTALHAQQQRTQQFDAQTGVDTGFAQAEYEFGQPSMFQGTLKTYQLKGMNWIANLYNQGINGILADEMGLGKTVQSIAFLAHIAERYDIWGPFLIVSPASTLHNWQQEVARFLPAFKVVPYWGSPQERKILRQFWTSKNLHTPEASFHVVITSYQLMVSDYKYFNRINWQYMVLDEAQAIKSASSARWKMLLEFNCRNRVLLSGTPIQNSMAELWALLHFIMPSLFDSHQEFSDWFSKDIESHAENKTSIDEKHLSRLHMILKPFMLRRIKKDVENELSDKIEIMMYCPLTVRQRALYAAIKKKIRIEDLLYSGGTSMSAQNVTSNLMNLVMQFRKVCNHPELFERREVKSALFWPSDPLVIPKMLYRQGVLYLDRSQSHLLENKFCVWNPEYLQNSLVSNEEGLRFAAFARFLGLSAQDVSQIALAGLVARWLHILQDQKRKERLAHRRLWQDYSVMEDAGFISSNVPEALRFVDVSNPGYTFLDVQLHPMLETVEHKRIRLKNAGKEIQDAQSTLIQEMIVTDRDIQTLETQWVPWPAMLEVPLIKVNCRGSSTHVSDRSAAWWLEKHLNCSSPVGKQCMFYGSPEAAEEWEQKNRMWSAPSIGGLQAIVPKLGWSPVTLPDKESLVLDSGKLTVLDSLLKKLRNEGHRVLIYSQMTRMIDLLEEYMWHRKLKYMRLDGSSKISERRDMVADFQSKSDIFVFLLSTRAGGLGINLTAADTVIFYDSDWNPTVDEQAMDRAHRLGQTKQVTVYRLICKGTIEERILQRAKEKSKIQRIVIAGGNFKPDTLKPTEVVSLLLDDEEIERKYRQRQAERRSQEEEREQERKRKLQSGPATSSTPSTQVDGANSPKKPKTEQETNDGRLEDMSASASPVLSQVSKFEDQDDTLVVDDNFDDNSSSSFGRLSPLIPGMSRKRPGRGTGRRGRPPGPGKRGRISGGLGRGAAMVPASPAAQDAEANSSADFSPVGVRSTSDGSSGSPQVKRGPGRPRLHPAGPAHQGSRGPPKKRGAPPGPRGPRVLKPLPVPLGTGTGTGTPLSQSPLSTPKPSPHPSPRPSPTPRSVGYYAPSSPGDER